LEGDRLFFASLGLTSKRNRLRFGVGLGSRLAPGSGPRLRLRLGPAPRFRLGDRRGGDRECGAGRILIGSLVTGVLVVEQDDGDVAPRVIVAGAGWKAAGLHPNHRRARAVTWQQRVARERCRPDRHVRVIGRVARTQSHGSTDPTGIFAPIG